jgi:ketosteroid isomerase-like protein
LASCGGGGASSADQQQIETAVRDLQQAFAAESTDRVCRLLSADARKHVEGMGHDLEGHPSGPCYFDLFMFIEGVQKSPTWRERTGREVSDIVVDGDTAKATVEFEDGQTASMPLVREEGRWRVDALYGAIPAGQQKDHY